MTLGALALTSDQNSRKGGGVPLENVVHMPAPYMFPEMDTVQYMETVLNDDHSGIEKRRPLFWKPRRRREAFMYFLLSI